MIRALRYAALLGAAVAVWAPAAASAQPVGFKAPLAGEGVAEQVVAECNLAGGSLSCAIYGIAPPANASCSFGGAVAEVRLAADGSAQAGFVCVDEGFHDWEQLGPGQSWRHGAFECTRRWTGSGVGRMEVLQCRNTAGRGFSVDGVGRIRTENTPQRSWLALGDSFASGHGIPGTVPGGSAQGSDCRRATGENTKATAWSVGSYQQVRESFGFSRIAFVACSGAITDAVASQIHEARDTSGVGSWDLVTVGFGGNNLQFRQVLEGCIDVPWRWESYDLTSGCDVTERQMRARVDMLTGKRAIDPGEYKGTVTLPTLLDVVAGVVRPGGDVIVTGYPQLVEETGRWAFWRRGDLAFCEGILDTDVGMLRSVTGYLNEQLGRAVGKADATHRADGIRFHFVDIARDPYEYSGEAKARHALCAHEPWINGLTPGISTSDWPFVRSFHPKQVGHTNTARVVAALIRKRVTFDSATQSSPPPRVATEVVLGVPNAFPMGAGWGTASPRRIFNGGAPSGEVTNIRWSDWGAPVARGTGLGAIYKPQGGYYPQRVGLELRAEDRGACRPGGPQVYRRLYARAPARPGGPPGEWFLWAGLKTLCHKAF